jgi:TatD DNase family protein
MARWADSHNHLHDPRLKVAEPLVPSMRQAGVVASVVNATCEADWPAVAGLAAAHPEFIRPAYGIHPWKAHTATAGWDSRLAEILQKNAAASIGECGLDGWIAEPPLEIQTPVFLKHLRLARELGRPVTIHCLKAWEPLLDAFRKEPPPGRFLMHSFGGSPEVARQLARLGAWFSISGYFLHPRKRKILEVFRKLPRDRILLETDAPDMLPPATEVSHPLPGNANHPANLPAIGAAIARTLGMEPEEFAALTERNHRRFFPS